MRPARYNVRMAPSPLPSGACPLRAPAHAAASPGVAPFRAFFALAKPRLATISVLTTLVAYATARPAGGGATLIYLLAGTSAAAAGALSFNQWSERRADALMRRTRHRPLPAAQLAPAAALGFSVACAVAGVATLAAGVNLSTALLAAATIVIYGWLYTPLKTRTRWATEIGAVSGALPALMGNAAAPDLTALPGLVLAAVLWCWQMPHFFALGWRHRADYRAAGFALLPAIDATGRSTAAWSLGYAALLVAVSLLPWAAGGLGPIFGLTATLLGAWFLHAAWRFLNATPERDAAATRLFAASIFYLPALMVALVADRLLST